MKFLLSVLMMFNMAPEEPPAQVHINPYYIIEESTHIVKDNNKSLEIINNILNK